MEAVEAVALAEVPFVGGTSHGSCGATWDDAIHREAVASGLVEIIKPTHGSADMAWWVRLTPSGRRYLLDAGKLPSALVRPQWPGSKRKSKHR